MYHGGNRCGAVRRSCETYGRFVITFVTVFLCSVVDVFVEGVDLVLLVDAVVRVEVVVVVFVVED